MAVAPAGEMPEEIAEQVARILGPVIERRRAAKAERERQEREAAAPRTRR